VEQELRGFVGSGLFYLRYTTGDPLENMRRTALRGLTEYVGLYADELASLEFEPEREFETLIPNEDLLISGSIDLVRLDDPPRVTIVDFKSGEQGESNQSGLSEGMMRLQIGIYGLAARRELEYDPDTGFIRYIGEQNPERRQVTVELGPEELDGAREAVIQAGRNIRERQFDDGPRPGYAGRCETCDQRLVCGLRQG
jgi:DNA helicase-2/ATP-dependent DNA helicase PcrA